MLLLASRQWLKLISPLRPLFSEASLVLAGAWPPPSVPKEKAYSRKTRAGNGTICPHLTLNPFLLGPQSWKLRGPSRSIRASQGFPAVW